MKIGMVGAGRMGANLARRIVAAGHECVVYDNDYSAASSLIDDGAHVVASLPELAAYLDGPRAVWVMVPAAVTGPVVDELAGLLDGDDVIIDGGNSHYRHAIERARRLSARGIHYLDVGTSGGVHGLRRGYCLMIGGPAQAVARLGPIFEALAPGVDAAPRTAGGAEGTAERGYLHCGGPGAGHFVKMIHNAIEYGQMAALGEGLAVLRNAGIGLREQSADAETAPLGDAEGYVYAFDVAAISEVWRRGSVISSWLLDLTASALCVDPDLAGYSGVVSDSGEGRWAVQAAVDEGVPAYVLTTALFERFSSRREGEYADKVISAMRDAFGGHHERKPVR